MNQAPLAQSPEEEEEELRRDWEDRVATGRPILTYEFDVPLILKLASDGQIELDCACLRIGNFSAAGVVRVRLSPAATQSLREMVADLGRPLGQHQQATSPSYSAVSDDSGGKA